MTAADWTGLTARRPSLTPRARRGAVDPPTRLRKSLIPAYWPSSEAASGECRVRELFRPRQRVNDRHPPPVFTKPDEGDATMRKSTLISVSISVSIAVLAAGVAISAQDKYTVKVPNGLAFSEFRGYERCPVIAISDNSAQTPAIR